jgi:L-threonylcarbamoyladenylate synthase
MSFVHLEQAVRILRGGGVIAYPTEGVFGLGCMPEAKDAVAYLLAIKRRSWRKGFVLVAANLEQVERMARLPSGPARQHVLDSWPGPVTWLLEAEPSLPSWLTGGRATVALRVSAHPLVQALCARVDSALVSTSANRSRRPPLRRLLHVRREFGAEIDYVLPGALGDAGRPTMIRDARSGRVLRPA